MEKLLQTCWQDECIIELKTQMAKMEERANSIDRTFESNRVSMDARLQSMNEFRNQLKDQAATFITRPEHEYVLKDIVDLKTFRGTLEGKASQNAVNVALMIAVSGIAISIIGIIIDWVNKVH